MRSDRPVTKILWLKNPGCLLVVGSSGVEVLQIANGWEIDLPFAKALKRLRGISAVAVSPGVQAPPCLWLVDRQRRMLTPPPLPPPPPPSFPSPLLSCYRPSSP